MLPNPLLTLLLLLLSTSVATAAPTVVAASPTRAVPGNVVTVNGGPFFGEVTVLVGDVEITPATRSERRLTFLLPPLPPGEYALALRDDQGVTPRPFTLTIVAPTPRIASLTPDNINACSSAEERHVEVTGNDIAPGATLLLGGNAVARQRTETGALTFTVPPLAAGAYGVQVVNPDGSASLPHSLYISDVPEIVAVRRDGEYVNHYQLVVEGKNFVPGATLVVTESAGDFFDLPPRQRLIRPGQDAGAAERLQAPSRGDRIGYRDCRTLVYSRYPASSQPRDLTLQVVNPDGKSSRPYQLSSP